MYGYTWNPKKYIQMTVVIIEVKIAVMCDSQVDYSDTSDIHDDTWPKSYTYLYKIYKIFNEGNILEAEEELCNMKCILRKPSITPNNI